jgi:hypothetical protein
MKDLGMHSSRRAWRLTAATMIAPGLIAPLIPARLSAPLIGCCRSFVTPLITLVVAIVTARFGGFGFLAFGATLCSLALNIAWRTVASASPAPTSPSSAAVVTVIIHSARRFAHLFGSIVHLDDIALGFRRCLLIQRRNGW